jgi:hypothetical protein
MCTVTAEALQQTANAQHQQSVHFSQEGWLAAARAALPYPFR